MAALLALTLGGAAAQAADKAPAREKVVVKVGDTPPDVFGKDEEGQQISLAALRGKVVILTFWTSWCPYCLKELPILESIQEKAGKAQLAVIAVNSREDRQTYRTLVRHLKQFQFTMTGDWRGVVSDAYGISSIPHMFFIDRDGKVARVYKGYSEESLPGMVADLNAVLAKPATVAASPAAATSAGASAAPAQP
jgi:thiol-disulfide isomerase/thioredoxin